VARTFSGYGSLVQIPVPFLVYWLESVAQRGEKREERGENPHSSQEIESRR